MIQTLPKGLPGQAADYQSALQALRASYELSLPSKIAEIETIWQSLSSTGWDEDSFISFIRLTHSLAGSGGTYGFTKLGESAHALELYAKSLPPTVPPPDQDRAEIETRLAQLKQKVSDISSGPALDKADPEAHPDPVLPGSTSPLCVWLYEPDLQLARNIMAELGNRGYRVTCTSDEHHLNLPEPKALPEALVIDWDAASLGFPGTELAAVELMHRREPALPIIFLSTRDDLTGRLDAVRHGATAYVVKSLVMTSLAEIVDAQTGKHHSDPFRILIVDDDAALAAYYAAILSHAGMYTRQVTNTLQVMRMLVDFRPDLILSDLYMPNMNGLELAAVLRQQDAYLNIPIVFLSSESDTDKQLSAMRLGGDDFMRKPVVPQHLVGNITSRVQRARMLRELAERDSLTGLLNHTRLEEQLSMQVARAKRTLTDLSFVMFDLDHFKDVNDAYGHLVGDRLLKNFARTLKQRLRESDILGRYGGEEFAAILPETSAGSAFVVIEELRELFAAIPQPGGESEFHVTFSAGIATLPPHLDAISLNQAADEALYRAKHEGRNKVVYALEED